MWFNLHDMIWVKINLFYESAPLTAYTVCSECTPRTFYGPPGVGWWITKRSKSPSSREPLGVSHPGGLAKNFKWLPIVRNRFSTLHPVTSLVCEFKWGFNCYLQLDAARSTSTTIIITSASQHQSTWMKSDANSWSGNRSAARHSINTWRHQIPRR